MECFARRKRTSPGKKPSIFKKGESAQIPYLPKRKGAKGKEKEESLAARKGKGKGEGGKEKRGGRGLSKKGGPSSTETHRMKSPLLRARWGETSENYLSREGELSRKGKEEELLPGEKGEGVFSFEVTKNDLFTTFGGGERENGKTLLPERREGEGNRTRLISLAEEGEGSAHRFWERKERPLGRGEGEGGESPFPFEYIDAVFFYIF